MSALSQNTTQVLTVNRTQARQNLPSLLDKVQKTGGPVYIDGKGADSVVLLSQREYKQLYQRKIQDNPMFGMWNEREDMKDSVRWVQNLRNKEDNRSYPK